MLCRMLVVAQGLHAGYNRTTAVSDLSFNLGSGEILAILGPNGSGKTTLFRLLLGLLAPLAGSLRVLGQTPGQPSALAQIGATIEVPSLYGHLSALENLSITAHLKSVDMSPQSLTALLVEVGLADALSAPVATFSLGMGQRLALAEALLGSPRLLILDEPTNGLDPEGIRWFREWVLRAVSAHNLGIILSSHILTEVAHIADRLLVLKNGRERFSGMVSELAGLPEVCLRVSDPAAASDVVRGAGFSVRQESDGLFVTAAPERVPELARLLVSANIDLHHLSAAETQLEERYLSLMEAP